jgi:hypothetical protein
VPLVHNHPQQPPGGYPFTDPSGVPFTADSIKALLAKITSYRTANGLPAGNPEKEVEADYQVRYPWLVSKVGVIEDTKEDPVARWINRQWKSPTRERDFVESETERVRLETCAACPYYATAHVYSPETSRRLTILGVGRIHDRSACMVNHWAVGYAALMPNPEGQVVEGCWASPSESSPCSTSSLPTCR